MIGMGLTAGQRVWATVGWSGRVARVDPVEGGLYVQIDGVSDEPTLVSVQCWVPAPCCGYCDRPAELRLIDGQPEDVLCKACARSQFGRPGDWVRALRVRDIRAYCLGETARDYRRRTSHKLAA